MRSLYKLLISVTLFLGVGLQLSAQEVVWSAGFDFFFDNREYKSEINWPQSLFGARISPEIGIRFEQNHSLMVGASLLADFGSKTFGHGNEAIVYYQYQTPKFTAALGVIPRRKMIGEYPSAFFSDSVYYYDPNISGVLLQRVGSRGFFEFGCDWNSMFSETTREKFMLFSAGRLNHRRFYAGYHFYMYHHAGRSGRPEGEDGVVDNVWIHPHIGVNLSSPRGLDSLTIQAGWLQTFQNDRKYVGEYVSPGGVQVEVRLEKWKFGIFNTFYAGKNLMPYYMAEADLDYGNGLYWGEPFYRTGNIYDRLELYWAPVRNDLMQLKVSSVHHFDGKSWGWQQKITFNLYLGARRLWNKK